MIPMKAQFCTIFLQGSELCAVTDAAIPPTAVLSFEVAEDEL